MKSLALVIFLLLASRVFGRIGENREQCDARYGNGTQSMNSVRYEKGGFVITAIFLNGKASSLEFSKPLLNGLFRGPLSENEISTLLDANLGKGKYTEGPVSSSRSWTTAGLVAVCDQSKLVICTVEFLEREKARAAEKEAERLKGF